MHRRVDVEAAGADRFEARLAFHDPVGRIFEMLDFGLSVLGEAAEQDKFLRGRLLGEIGVDPPVVGGVRIGLIGNQDGWLIGKGEEVIRLGQGLGLGSSAVERDPPTHFPAVSFASRSSRRLVRAAA